MKKSELIDRVAERAEMSRAAAARAVDAVFGTAGGAIAEAVSTVGKLSIPDFGKFTARIRAARKGRNPRTGVVIHVPARTTVTFSPGRKLRDALAERAGEGRGNPGASSRRK